MGEKIVELVVGQNQVGQRVDKFLADNISDLSRAKIKRLIKDGLVRTTGHLLEPNYRIRQGEEITVRIPPEEEFKLEQEEIPLKIKYEDQDCLVVDKQAGLVVHPAVGHLKGTLVNAVLNHVSGMVTKEAVRPGIVHRLDKDTSGLIVIAKNEKALEYLKNQFKKRKVVKKYLALVHGQIKEDFGVIRARIGRHPVKRQKFSVTPKGKESETEFKVVKRFRDFTLIEAQPKTGRTHQIRVHFSYLSHPLVGDSLYGGKQLLGRQFLHAATLGFKLPSTEKYVEFFSELPQDLKEFLSKLTK
ncbi:MAG: RluA family pseudouridine synthase [Patescibacteria group bacterium]|nr:RluA family pseudouridine synthase [Patescibacteria group bacterium]MCL5411707.1 RluA family pseudouridine synthase [Patescibacteria group bacterium]